MSTKVVVRIAAAGNGKKAEEFAVSVPTGMGVDHVCELKRQIEAKTKIAPETQRLQLVAGADSFSVPPVVTVAVRTRNPTLKLQVSTTDATKREVCVVSAASDDSILDLKFMVGRVVQQPAEYVRLYWMPPNVNHLVELESGQTVAGANLPNNAELRIVTVILSKDPGHGNIHRTVIGPLRTTYSEDPTVKELCAHFRRAVRLFPNNNYLGTRIFDKNGVAGDYKWQSYKDVGVRVTNIGSALLKLGLKPGESVGIMSANRSEWVITDLACSCQSLVSVPLYDTLGPDAVEYIINHASVRAVIVSHPNVKHVADVRAKCPTLEFIVLMDDQLTQKEAATPVPCTHRFSELEKLGAAYPSPDHPPKPEDVFTICYTSGTTGMPKGAILSHANMIAAVAAAVTRMPDNLDKEEVLLSYLPLAHIYERLMQSIMLHRGYSSGFFQGDAMKLVDDVMALRPTFFPGVPRVWQRIHDRIKAQVEQSNFIRRALFNKAYQSKLEALKRGDYSETVWDRLVFKKVAEKFGGRIKGMVSGAAPLSPDIAHFMKITMVSKFGEGYGLTETCAALTGTFAEDTQYAVAGYPTSCADVKLVDVPDMDYLTTDKPCPRGEIWVRGPSVFVGYYKQPDQTAEVFENGWFKTGDVGQWRPDGNLQIIDRKKNIFKLSQGEYIRAEYIEGVYKQDRFVANVFVHGDSTQNYLVGIVVPNIETLKPWAIANGLKEISESLPALCSNEKVKKMVFASMTAVGVKNELRGFEFVRKIHLTPEDFSVANGLLTPTFKLKRHQAKLHYKPAIDAMYAEPETPLPSKL